MSIEVFDSFAAWDTAVLEVIKHAEREIHCFDVDLQHSPMPASRGVDALQNFLNTGPKHRIILILHETGHLLRNSARLLDLYRKRAHQFSVHRVADQHRSQLQAFISADGKHLATRFHADHARGKLVLDESSECVWFNAQFETLLESSTIASDLAILGI